MYSFHTDDHALAAKAGDLWRQHHGHPGLAPSTVAPTPHPGLAPAYAGPPAQSVAAQPPSSPPAAAMPPPPAAAPATPPPPAAPPPAAVPTAIDAEDQAIIDSGWTIDHVKSAAQAFVKKHGNAGPGKIAEMAQKYLPGVPKPTVAKVPAKYWPALHQELSAA